MKFAYRALLAAVVLAAAASPAAAQMENVKFVGAGDPSASSHSTTVGTLQLQVLSQPGQPTIDVYCVDYQHSVSNGQTWNAMFSNVMGDLSHTRAGAAYGDALARTRYQKAAYLTTLYAGATDTEMASINSAIWNILDSGSPNWTGSSYYRSLAAANYATAGLDYSTFSVITHQNRRGGLGERQEFLTQVTTTPEPSTYLMMASGLIGLAGFGYRRRRSLES